MDADLPKKQFIYCKNIIVPQTKKLFQRSTSVAYRTVLSRANPIYLALSLINKTFFSMIRS